MGSIMDPRPETVISEAMAYKEESLLNPDGVIYMDHLWDLVADREKAKLVLCTDEEVFSRVPVRTLWNYGNYDFDDEKTPYRSSLLFEIPDEVTRSIQSNHMQKIMKRFFGISSIDKLPQPVVLRRNGLDDRDENRRNNDTWGKNTVRSYGTDTWPSIKKAIKMTAEDPSGYLGGQTIRLLSTAGICSGAAKFVGNDLRIKISEDGLESINKLWSEALSKELQFDTSNRR